MNERIRELAEQADDYTDNKIQQPGEYHPDWHDIRDQKFAELIVRECAQACINEGKTYAVESAGQYQSNLYATAIKKHFGVE